MAKGQGVPFLLLILVLILRPHMAGAAFPFAQGLLLIPGLVALAVLFLKTARHPLVDKRHLWTAVLPWALLAWSLVSLFWTPDPGQGVRECVSLLCGLTVFTAVLILVQDGPVLERVVVPVSALVVVPVLASAIYQRLFGLARIRETLVKLGQSGEPVADLAGFLSQNRVFAGFLNSNMLAGFLAVILPLTLDLALSATQRRRVYYFSILTALEGVVLLLTGSLGGILVALVMTGSVVILRRGIRPRTVAAVLLLALLLLGGLVGIRGTSFLVGADSSVGQRAGYMAAGLRMADVHPLLGWGAGAAPGALMGFVRAGIRPVADPHNFLVRAWISWGLPGVALLIAFFSLWVRNAGELLRRGEGRAPGPGHAGIFFAGAAFLVHSLVDMDFFVPETALFGWCVLGVALGLTADPHPPGGKKEGQTFVSRTRVGLGALALLLVLPAFAVSQAESLAYRGKKAMESKDYRQAAALFSQAGAILPFSGRFALDEGRARAASGEENEAARLFGKAGSLMRASPYPAWELGRADQTAGRWADSIAPLETALSRYGTSPRIRIDLALAYLNLGEREQVLRLLVEARALAVFDHEARELADGILSEGDR